EDAMDKEVADKVKDHKRKHDSDDDEDDDDDEGPSAGSNQALTSTGWQITDTRDVVVNSLMHMLPNNIQITNTSLMHMLNSDPVPPRQNVVPTAEKTDSSQQGLCGISYIITRGRFLDLASF
ncbi:hypothetical protein Tco_0062274, partial [Tanacetum coccineum]